MKLENSISVETPGDIEYLEYLTINPTLEGVELSAKSKVIGTWAEMLSAKANEGSPVHNASGIWGGRYYAFPGAMVKAIPHTVNDRVGGEMFLSSGGPGGAYLNISWIRHIDLKDGFTIKVNIPSAADYDDFLPACEEALRTLYVNCIRKNKMTLKLKEIRG
jgi:hypothetical protein